MFTVHVMQPCALNDKRKRYLSILWLLKRFEQNLIFCYFVGSFYERRKHICKFKIYIHLNRINSNINIWMVIFCRMKQVDSKMTQRQSWTHLVVVMMMTMVKQHNTGMKQKRNRKGILPAETRENNTTSIAHQFVLWILSSLVHIQNKYLLSNACIEILRQLFSHIFLL